MSCKIETLMTLIKRFIQELAELLARINVDLCLDDFDETGQVVCRTHTVQSMYMCTARISFNVTVFAPSQTEKKGE